MKIIRFDKASRQTAFYALERFFARVPYRLLIQRFLAVRLVLLTGIFMAALLIVIALLYLPAGSEVLEVTESPAVLNTEVIDDLELWLEERQTEREKTIVAGQRRYFQH